MLLLLRALTEVPGIRNSQTAAIVLYTRLGLLRLIRYNSAAATIQRKHCHGKHHVPCIPRR